MFDVCPGCGAYNPARDIDPASSEAVCPLCGHRQPFRRLPLFIITGASGAGKSALCLALAAQPDAFIALETDIFWNACFDQPEDDYRAFRELCLRAARDIGQGGRPVVLCGSATPSQFESCIGFRYFSAAHYLALVCPPAILADRLRARPPWRASGSPDFIDRMIAYNQWFIDHPDGLTLHDTAAHTPAQTVAFARAWLNTRV